MNALKKLADKLQLKKFWKDESAQGMTEYILLVVVVVTLAYVFRNKIKSAIGGKMNDVSSGINDFQVDTSGN